MFNFFNQASNASSDASKTVVQASVVTTEKLLEHINEFNKQCSGTIFSYPNIRQAVVAKMQQVFANPSIREAMGLYYEIKPDGTLTTELLNKINAKIRKLFSDEVLEKLGNIPEEFICPISFTIMQKPVKVITMVGGKEFTHYFEESAIEKWIDSRGRINPMNRQPIIRIESGDDLKRRIFDFIENATHKVSSSSSSSSAAVKR